MFSFNFSLTLTSFTSLWISLTCSLYLGFFFQLSVLFKLGERYTVLHCFISDKQCEQVNSETSCISNCSLVKEDKSPPSTLFLVVLWEGMCVMATTMLMALIVETSYYQVPYIHHFTYPQDILFVGFVLWHSTILPKGRLRHHMVIWLTQDCRTERVFTSKSLPWYMHKILTIMCLIKMIRKYTGPLQWQLYLNTDS